MTVSEAYGRGLRDALAQVNPKGKRWRGILGFSPSTGRRYHALHFADTNELVVLLLPSTVGAAGEVSLLPDDVVWQ